MMKKNIISFVLVLFLGTNIFHSCAKNNTISNKEYTTKIVNRKGIFHIDNKTREYFISVHTPGTIDEVSTYIIISPDQNIKLLSNNSEVIFSGIVTKSNKTSMLGGQTYYNIKITKIN